MADAISEQGEATAAAEQIANQDAFRTSVMASRSSSSVGEGTVAPDDAQATLKLRMERQTAELNAKELLLTRKQERIDELSALLQQVRTDSDDSSGSAISSFNTT